MNKKAASETHQWVDLFVAAAIQVIYWKRGDNCKSAGNWLSPCFSGSPQSWNTRWIHRLNLTTGLIRHSSLEPKSWLHQGNPHSQGFSRQLYFNKLLSLQYISRIVFCLPSRTTSVDWTWAGLQVYQLCTKRNLPSSGSMGEMVINHWEVLVQRTTTATATALLDSNLEAFEFSNSKLGEPPLRVT